MVAQENANVIAKCHFSGSVDNMIDVKWGATNWIISFLNTAPYHIYFTFPFCIGDVRMCSKNRIYV